MNMSGLSIPTDRQLALRAKLQKGWSTGRPETPLSPREQEAIRNVVKRNEELEMEERKRVGRLVERVENIKSRITENGPKNCRLCGMTFGILGPSKIICDGCKKPICSKCCIELSSSKLQPKKVLWLCQICSETRELWKKTGAWFYHSLPTYEISPERAQTCRISKNIISLPLKEAVTRNKNFHHQQQGTNFIDVDSTSSSGDADETASIGQISRSLDAISFNNVDAQSNHYQRYSITSTDSLTPDAIRACSTYNPAATGTTAATQRNASFQDAVLGWIEISVVYDESNHLLVCNVLRARDLTPMDTCGLADPFCKVNVIVNECFKYCKWLKSKIAHKTVNPEFNELLNFIGMEPHELQQAALFIVVLDDDKYGHDILGAARFDLHSIALGGPTVKMSLPLCSGDERAKVAQLSEIWPRGRILISLCYNTTKRALMVFIKQCENLIPMDGNGYSDPFVKIFIRPDSHRKKCKTGVKWRTLNPIFQEEFSFETRPSEMDKQTLYISVWDRDLAKSDDFLGSLIIGHTSKGSRLKQWRDCIRLPDQYHERWHYLSNEIEAHHH